MLLNFVKVFIREETLYVDDNCTPLPCIPCSTLHIYFLYFVTCNIRKNKIETCITTLTRFDQCKLKEGNEEKPKGQWVILFTYRYLLASY